MTKLMIAFAAMLSVAGCKKSGGANESMEKMDGFAKQMCECKDKACADKVQDEMTKWSTEAAKSAKTDDKADPETTKKAEQIATKYAECMAKATMGGDMHGAMKGGD